MTGRGLLSGGFLVRTMCQPGRPAAYHVPVSHGIMEISIPSIKETAVATVAEVFALALQHHEAGHLNQAEQLYQQILDAEPYHADTHHSLGVLAFQRGNYESAVTLIHQALKFN